MPSLTPDQELLRRLAPMLERELRELRQLPASGAEAAAYIGSVREILACGERDQELMLIARLSALGELAIGAMDERVLQILKRERREAVRQGLIADPCRSVEDRAAALMGRYASLLERRAAARHGATPIPGHDILELLFTLPEMLAGVLDLHECAHDAALANGAACMLLCRVSTPAVDADRQFAAIEALRPILARVGAELGNHPTDVEEPRHANPGAALARWHSALTEPVASKETDIWVERAAASIVVLAVTEDSASPSLLGALSAQAAARLSESGVFDDPSLFDTASVFQRSTRLAGWMACSWLKAQCEGEDGRLAVNLIAAEDIRAIAASTVIGAWAAPS